LLTSELGFDEEEALALLNNYHNENLKMLQEIEHLKSKVTSQSKE